jgi:chromosome segregation ATPase
MNEQQIINILIGIAGTGVAWWVKTMWGMVRSQQEQITALNLKLAENYVQKIELEKTFTKLFDGMDEIKKEISHISKNQASIKAYNEMLSKVKP